MWNPLEDNVFFLRFFDFWFLFLRNFEESVSDVLTILKVLKILPIKLGHSKNTSTWVLKTKTGFQNYCCLNFCKVYFKNIQWV